MPWKVKGYIDAASDETEWESDLQWFATNYDASIETLRSEGQDFTIRFVLNSTGIGDAKTKYDALKARFGARWSPANRLIEVE